MPNSFYYFYSASAQVLAAVMALFGVFVIFKIQSLKEELIFFGKKALPDVKLHSNGIKGRFNDSEEENVCHRITLEVLSDSIEQKNVRRLSTTFSTYEKEFEYGGHNYHNAMRAFHIIYDTLELIKCRTVISSVLTSVVIVICLIIIPFDNYLLCHPVLTSSLYFVISFLVIVIFSVLINILIISVGEKYKGE
jgi:hypothetical protein